MKKKLIPLILAPVCAIACAAGLAACSSNGGGNGGGGKTWTGTVLVDSSGAEHDSEYDMGTYYYQSDVKPDLSSLRLYSTYSDGTKDLLETSDSKLRINYAHENNGISSLPDEYDVGEYTIEYTYTLSYSASVCVSFKIVPSATASPYQLSLDKDSWDYLEEPAVTVTKGGTAIDEDFYEIRSITKDNYDEIKDDADFGKKLEENSEDYYPDVTKPGEYYLFAYTRTSVYDNFIYNSNFVAVGIFKGEVVPESADFSDFKGLYEYRIDRIIGNVKLSELYIQGEMEFKNAGGSTVSGDFEWCSPDTEVNYTHNNAQGMAIKFVPEESDCYNEYIVPELIPLNIEKGLVPKLMRSQIEYTYDGEEHEFTLISNDSYRLEIFLDLVTVKWNDTEITVGEDGVLGKVRTIGDYEYTFELKDKVNYCWNSDDVDDVANKSFTYKIKPKKSAVFFSSSHYIDENKQVKIPLIPGTMEEIDSTETSKNITPYKSGTLNVVVLDEITTHYGDRLEATVDAEAEIVKEGGYDILLITVNQFKEDSSGRLLLQITANGDDNYADINVDNGVLYIHKYPSGNVPECPVIADLVENEQLDELEMVKPVGITVAELYAAYPGLRTAVGGWVLYMDYNENGNWTALPDSASLPLGRLKCKLVYESDFVWGVENLRPVEFTLVGVQSENS